MGAKDISPEVMGKLVAFVRKVGELTDDCAVLVGRADIEQEERLANEVRAIVALLPEPVDPDLIEARELVAKTYDAHALSSPWHTNEAIATRAGGNDRSWRVMDALAGIKRGRQLSQDQPS